MEITLATKNDINDILAITRLAFSQYQAEIHSQYRVAALSENEDEVLFDIENNHVIIARENDLILGCIRYKALSNELAYVYRFSVSPSEQNGGVGTSLIEYVIEDCQKNNFKAIALHTNAKYFKLARYYYGKQFFVHSTTNDRGYIRALFVKELTDQETDLTEAFKM